jgi:HEAT repeat protein
MLADAAINAMRAQDDPGYLAPLKETLQQNEPAFTTGGFARGLENLAWLARNQEKKDAVREFLVGYVNSKKQRVQLATINALGTLGDPKAIAVLEKFTTAKKESPERVAAEKSLTSLRDTKKPSAELGTLRSEVLNLQKENRELRKEFDELKKRLDVVAPKPLAAKTNKAARPKRARD